MAEVVVINSLSSHEEIFPLLKIKKYERFAKDRLDYIFNNASFDKIMENFPQIISELFLPEIEGLCYVKLSKYNKKIFEIEGRAPTAEVALQILLKNKNNFKVLKKVTSGDFIVLAHEAFQNVNEIKFERPFYEPPGLADLYPNHKITYDREGYTFLTRPPITPTSSPRSSTSRTN